MATRPVAFARRGHDHAACIADALSTAQARCTRRGLRLTATRRRVLELIWANHRPTKAYDLLETLAAERDGAAPPTVYRALDFLLEAGLVHRIESLNAFIGCDVDHATSRPKFLICRGCEQVAEIASDAIDAAVSTEAARAGFVADRETVEVAGLCAACARRGPA